VYADALIRPWADRLLEDLPGVELVDAHTHLGRDDPDGFTCTAEELCGALDLVGSRATVFAMHEPAGYPAANDRVVADAEASDGRLVPYCRVDPARDPEREAARSLDRGARGVKLHPRAEGFTLDHPGVARVVALAAERRVPVIVHAGRGIPALGRHALELSGRFPGAPLILAHAGISDLSWIWRHLGDRPNLYFDTAWWNPVELVGLFSLVPPGQILHASDAPYGTPTQSVVMTLRSALEAGLGSEQVAGVAGAQLDRLVAGSPPLDLGPAPGPRREPLDLLLERVCSLLHTAVGQMLSGGDGVEYLSLARLACEVGEDAPQAAVCRSVLALLDRHERFAPGVASGAPVYQGMHLVITALAVARTPGVALPLELEAVSVGEREP